MTEGKMVGWHHQINGYEFKKTPGVGDGQGGLACCSPWGCKESDTTERLNWNIVNGFLTKEQRKCNETKIVFSKNGPRTIGHPNAGGKKKNTLQN